MEYNQNGSLLDTKKINNNEDDCIINNNPINYYLNTNSSKNTLKIPQNEINKTSIFSLNDPRLIQAYNEGYYGINNIPKQYYVYPNFCNYNKTNKNNEKKIINKNLIDEKIFQNVKERDNKKDNRNIKQFPFLQQINYSSNIFGKFHSINVYNNLDKILENNKKEIENEKSENSINISMKLSDDKELRIKGYGRILNNKNIVYNKEIIEPNDDENEKYDENFYCINNTITRRNINNVNKLYENNNDWENSEIN